MFRFPYMRNSYNNRINRRPSAQQQNEQQNALLSNASFSPQLSFLLSMVLKDGFSRNTTFDLLRNIYPYVEPGDKSMIDKIFGIQEFARGYKPGSQPNANPGRALSKQERDIHLLRVLRQYAAQDTVRIFNRYEQAIRMQQDLSRMMNRLEALRKTKVTNPDELLNTMESFLPPEERKNIRNISNMLNLFRNMGGFKPEDIMKMFGGGSQSPPNR